MFCVPVHLAGRAESAPRCTNPRTGKTTAVDRMKRQETILDAWFLRHCLEHTGEFEFKSLIYVFRKGTVTVVLAGSTMSAPQPSLLPRSSSASTAAAALEAGTGPDAGATMGRAGGQDAPARPQSARVERRAPFAHVSTSTSTSTSRDIAANTSIVGAKGYAAARTRPASTSAAAAAETTREAEERAATVASTAPFAALRRPGGGAAMLDDAGSGRYDIGRYAGDYTMGTQSAGGGYGAGYREADLSALSDDDDDTDREMSYAPLPSGDEDDEMDASRADGSEGRSVSYRGVGGSEGDGGQSWPCRGGERGGGGGGARAGAVAQARAVAADVNVGVGAGGGASASGASSAAQAAAAERLMRDAAAVVKRAMLSGSAKGGGLCSAAATTIPPPPEHVVRMHRQQRESLAAAPAAAAAADDPPNILAKKLINSHLSSSSPSSTTKQSSRVRLGTHPVAPPLETCDKCKRTFISLTNLQRHKGIHRFGAKAKPPAATRDQIAACWVTLSVEKRAEVLDLAVGGEAGVLVLAAFGSRPRSAAVPRRATQDSASPSAGQKAAADYAKAGVTLRDAVDQPLAHAAALGPCDLLVGRSHPHPSSQTSDQLCSGSFSVYGYPYYADGYAGHPLVVYPRPATNRCSHQTQHAA